MARLGILVCLLAVGAAVTAAPTEEYEPLSVDGKMYNIQEETSDHLRFRRVTCDLLTFGGKVGHSACAANCLSMGKAGGRCNNGVCQCRKTKFSDLWKKRFG